MEFKSIMITGLLGLACWSVQAQKQTMDDFGQAQALSKEVTQLFSEEKIEAAINALEPYWPIPASEVESITKQTLDQLSIIQQRYGNAIGIIKVKEEKIADIAVRETYLVRHEHTAIRLIFTYYKNDKGWIVNGFRWDDAFKEEFK